MCSTLRAAALLVAANLALTGCSRTAEPPRKAGGLLVVAIDALRPDHLTSYGYDPERRTSPRLDRLAEEGTRFTQAFSAAPTILPAHVGLLTGCAPVVARRMIGREHLASLERRWRIPDKVPRLAVELLSAGYRTAAFMDHPRLAPLHGFAAGFEELVEAEGDEQEERTTPTTRRSINRFLQWLRSVDRDDSWFAYLHVNDLDRLWASPDPRWDDFFPPRDGPSHVPPVGTTDSVLNTIPRTRWRGGARGLNKYEAIYDGHVRRIDTELDRLFANLEVMRRYEETTIVVIGATGLQFGEAGLYLQSGLYSMTDLHVPWILKPAAALDLPGGRTYDGVVGTMDLAPTLIELAGLEVPAGTHGRSLVDILRDPCLDPVERVVFGSCGLLEGCVAIGPRYAFELVYPERAERQLRRSWLGSSTSWSAENGRFYDRLLERQPNLGPNADRFVPEGPAEAAAQEEMARVAGDWIRRIRLTRRVLQLGDQDWGEDGDSLRIEELRHLGYLAP